MIQSLGSPRSRAESEKSNPKGINPAEVSQQCLLIIFLFSYAASNVRALISSGDGRIYLQIKMEVGKLGKPKMGDNSRQRWRTTELELPIVTQHGINTGNTLLLLAKLEVALTVTYEAIKYVLVARKQLQGSELNDDQRQPVFTSLHFILQGAILSYSRCFEFSGSALVTAMHLLGKSFLAWWIEGLWLPANGSNMRTTHCKIIKHLRSKGVRHYGSNWSFLIPYINKKKNLQLQTQVVQLAHGGENFDEIANILHNFTSLALVSIRHLLKSTLARKGQIISKSNPTFNMKCHPLENCNGKVDFRVGLNEEVSMLHTELKFDKSYHFKKHKISIKLNQGCINFHYDTKLLGSLNLPSSSELIIQQDDACKSLMKIMNSLQTMKTLITSLTFGIDTNLFPKLVSKITCQSWISGILTSANLHWDIIVTCAKKQNFNLDNFPTRLRHIANNAAHNATRGSEGLEVKQYLVEAAICCNSGQYLVEGQLAGWDPVTLEALRVELKDVIVQFCTKVTACVSELSESFEIKKQKQGSEYQIEVVCL